MKLILASRSPRRKQLLEGLGYQFETDPSTKDEIFDPYLSVDDALKKVAMSKAEDVAKRHPNDVVLAADTIVVYKDRILGKPKDSEDAFNTLKSLSGNEHEVKTGIAIVCPGHKKCSELTTVVRFRDLSDEEIQRYVDTGGPLDKAGSYGIQDVDFAESIDGSHSNVVGLPIRLTAAMLNDLQIDPEVHI